jgi:hypothetical protein
VGHAAGSVPEPRDVADAFTVTLASVGRIANDRVGNDATGTNDFHGTGLVYLEYARLVQDALNASLPAEQRHALGDAACLPGATAAGATPTFAAGCTGFEGFVTPAPNTDPAFARNAYPWTTLAQNPSFFALAGGLKPGHQQGVFCNDAAGDVTKFAACDGADAQGNPVATLGATGDLLATSLARVTAVLGKGDSTKLPADAQKTEFYFEKFAAAFTKYLLVAGTPDETAHGVHGAPLSAADLTFAQFGNAQFSEATYTDRRFAKDGGAPLVLTVSADLFNGTLVRYGFAR